LEKWSTFATVAGGAAAALTGLLFVAVSIRIGVIAKSQELRNRAAQTLTLFVTVLFIATLLSIPDQSLWVLGAELVALAVITAGGLMVLGRRARTGPDPRDATAHAVASILEAVAPNTVTSILVAIAGLLLIFGLHAGLDVLVLPVLVALAGGIASAWLLLTKIPQQPRAYRQSHLEASFRFGLQGAATRRRPTLFGACQRETSGSRSLRKPERAPWRPYRVLQRNSSGSIIARAGPSGWYDVWEVVCS